MPADVAQRAPTEGSDAITKKSEYSRFLIAQKNSVSGEEVRTQAKAGSDMIKARETQHTAVGLSRQQASAEQMKRVSEAREAHHAQNLELGRTVNKEVSEWKQGAAATKEEWRSHAKTLKESVKGDDQGKASVAAMSAQKKEQAARTREEDAAKAKELDALRELFGKTVQTQAAKVKAETSDAVIDQSKRVFYEQRLKAASEVKHQKTEFAKSRADEQKRFQEAQKSRRNRAKTARQAAGKSKANLLTQRQQEGITLREKKRALLDERTQRLQQDTAKRTDAVKAAIRNSFVQPEGADAEVMLQMTGGSKSGASRSPPTAS